MLTTLVALLTVARLGTAAATGGALPDAVRFNRDVRPILAEKCFGCHGAGAKTRETKLRLDSADEAMREHGGRRAVVPGKAGESELVRRIFSNADDEVMPPPKDGRPLTPRERELLKRWVEQGAKWESHWAFIPPQRAPEPAVRDTAWPRNFIDSFILAKLEAEGVAPSPEADRRTLLRRLSFDLTGLPPRPEAVEEFVHTIDPAAYERQVVRLMSLNTSPQFGERMAMFWLDLVRYADTDGYHADNPRAVWPYRDYVVAAFNENRAFDQFTREQIAGDLLPGAGQEQRVASTYNLLVKTTEEGGANAEEYLLRYAADRVRNTASVWLGLTLGCAECHDHKSDPLKQRDFYRFAACFADLKEAGVGPRIPVRFPSAEQQSRLAALKEKMDAADARLDAVEEEALSGRDPWVQKVQAAQHEQRLAWRPVRYLGFTSRDQRDWERRPDGSLVIRGPEREDNYTIEFSTAPGAVDSLRLEMLRDPEVVRAVELSGFPYEYYLSEVALEIIEPGAAPRGVTFDYVIAEANRTGHLGIYSMDGDPKTSWGIGPEFKSPVIRIAFHLKETVEAGPQTRWRVRLENHSGVAHGNLRHFRLSMAPEGAWHGEDQGLPAPVAKVMSRTADSWTDADRETLREHLRRSHPAVWPLSEMAKAASQEREAVLMEVPASLISESGASRVTRVLPRGNWMDQSGPVVIAGVPALFDPAGRCTNRLDLARWLVARDNPLTARVFVNRVWKLFFGTGLVTTLDDFGVAGDSPSHPELLDRLAVEFMESGWSVKQLVLWIVNSRTYRQASAGRPELEARDPRNRLFARQGRWRLEAEVIRDNALRAAGILVTNLGGPTVYLYHPVGVLDHLDFPKRGYAPSPGLSQYRRSLYAFWQRSFLNPVLAVFDAPSREECVAERPVSNTPLQALALLNCPAQVEAAVALAAYAANRGGRSPPERVAWIFDRVLQRPPEPDETTALVQLHAHQRERLRGQDARVTELQNFGQYRLAPGLSGEEVAAWTAVSRAVLNLHETITRY
ncbi:MAG: PSD1 domain-containing protein [Verrucomicrobia bacterium]|nr:PSD1 domain-containing protein [Verrucomicrobiota bacterium]